MTYEQPSRAPDDCRLPLCGYLEQRTVGNEHHDRCSHRIPMHNGCAWHRTPEQVALIAAQECFNVERFNEVFGKKRK